MKTVTNIIGYIKSIIKNWYDELGAYLMLVE